MSVRSLGLLPLAVFASLAAAACSSAEPASGGASDPGAEDDIDQSEDALGANCTYSRKWYATLRDRACAPVAGYRGKWVPSPLFADAPEDSSSCLYSWQGERYSRADQTALQGSIQYGEGLAPACRDSRPIEGELYPIEQMDVIGMAGGVGCDVCGIVIGRNDRINVILPPGKIVLKQVGVRLSNGESRSFQLVAPENARLVSFKLPPPPAGTHYVSSKVTVY